MSYSADINELFPHVAIYVDKSGLRKPWVSLNITRDVRFWHKADMTTVVGKVRFRG
jgi:hypothetical protein